MSVHGDLRLSGGIFDARIGGAVDYRASLAQHRWAKASHAMTHHVHTRYSP